MEFNKKLIDLIGVKLKNKNLSVAVAESVTSGLLQAAFSNADGASFFFQGGITAYNIGQKCRHLLVEPLHAIECNCVSEKVSQQIAVNISNLFVSDYGIGITGYAEKLPEKNIHDLFAYYAISSNENIINSGRIVSNEEEGLATQLFFVNNVLKTFNELLK
jgi:PncC family amidohydrolase